MCQVLVDSLSVQAMKAYLPPLYSKHTRSDVFMSMALERSLPNQRTPVTSEIPYFLNFILTQISTFQKVRAVSIIHKVET